MENKKLMSKIITLFLIFNLFMISVFSSAYAADDVSMMIESEEETVQASEPLEKPITKNQKLNLMIIGEGDILINDDEGNEVITSADLCDGNLQAAYPDGSLVKIKATVRDESCFIYGFYIKEGDQEVRKEEITGKGAVCQTEVTMDETISILIVFADMNEKEIVFDNPLASTTGNAVQTLSLGDIGQNWGMYNLFTSYTKISEFGSSYIYPYSHIIQVDTNYDYIYEDITYTAYCIEYARECPSGGYLTESDLTTTQMDYIGYAMAYGWRQNVTYYDEDLYNDSYARSESAVTQGIIWCCTKGIFNTEAGDAAMTKVINATHQPLHAKNYYNNLKKIILNVDTKPSFDGNTITLEWNSDNNRYEATIVDSNEMLEYYDYSGTGLGFSKNGNNLTIYTTKDYSNGIEAKGTRVVYGGKNSVKTWDAWNGKQDMATYVDYSHKVISNIIIKTKSSKGSLTLNKYSSNIDITDYNENYSLEGAEYGVYTDSSCTKSIGTLTTTASGTSNVLSLDTGDYYVKENVASKGFALDSNVYKVTITGGNTTNLSVPEMPITGNLIIQKQSSDASIMGDNSEYSDMTATFYVYNAQSEHVGTVITDIHGDGKITGLPLGNYTVKEKEAPIGYTLNLESQSFTISADEINVTKTFVNDPKLGRIVLTKTIHAEDINFDNGNPMFTLKVTGTDANGVPHTYYKIVDFTKDYVNNYTNENGDVSMSVVFEKLIAGDYISEEMETSRYALEAIDDVENGTIIGETVHFSLRTSGNMEGSATFINDNYEQQNFSDSAKVINELKK